jgi:hypothetical protein
MLNKHHVLHKVYDLIIQRTSAQSFYRALLAPAQGESQAVRFGEVSWGGMLRDGAADRVEDPASHWSLPWHRCHD